MPHWSSHTGLPPTYTLPDFRSPPMIQLSFAQKQGSLLLQRALPVGALPIDYSQRFEIISFYVAICKTLRVFI